MDPVIVYHVQAGPFWDWKVATDLFLGGAGVGAFLFSIALYEFWNGRYRRIPQTAAIIAPLLVGSGLLFLMLKLGRPFQLFQTFTNFAPTSPLWWGGVFQTIFIAGALWYAWKWRTTEADRGRRMLGLALTPIAIIVGAYHGLLLAVITARPLWNTGPTVVASLLAFTATGIAAVMLVHLIRMKVAGRLDDTEHIATFLEDIKPVRNVLVATLVLQLGTFFLWWLSLLFGSLQDRQALEAANAAYGPMFWWLGIGVGLVFPLALGAYSVWRGEQFHRHRQVVMIGVTSVSILLGGFAFRLAVVLAGQVSLPIVSVF